MKSIKYKAYGLILLVLSAVSWAHGDEDHGDKTAVPIQQGQLPSAESHSEQFGLLAQLNGAQLTVYLDRRRDNSPIANAQIEVESGAFKAQLKPVSAGIYQADAGVLAQQGEHLLAFTIVAGDESDLLDATLKVAAPAVGDADHAEPALKLWQWLSAGVIILIAVFFILQVRQRRRQGGKL